MEAEQVIEKILADARSQADNIKKEADEQLADRKNQLDEQLAKYKEETSILADKAKQEKKSHLLAAARMDTAKAYLSGKRAILDEVFSESRKQLKSLPDDEYKKLMKNLILKAVETGEEEVIVDNNETRIDDAFIKQVNSELPADKKGKLKLSDEKQNIEAGFVLKRGKIKNNASLDVLLTQAEKELQVRLAKELFES